MSGGSSLVRIGTRGSELALWQARSVACRVEQAGLSAELVVIKTRGDRDQATPFGLIEGKELFTREIEDALLARRIDLAVHSLKDLPARLPEGTELLAVPRRESPLDAWVCPGGQRLKDLPPGGRVATGSLRRAAQLRALRPDLVVVELRGNVPTRLEKIRSGQAEAGILAVAGLRRLGLAEAIVEPLDPERFTPPAGQGAIAVQARIGEFYDLAAALTDPASWHAVAAERRFLEIVGAGCRAPVGVLATEAGSGRWRMTAAMATTGGDRLVRRSSECDSVEQLFSLAERLSEQMLSIASPEIIATLREKRSSASASVATEGALAGCTVVLTRPPNRIEKIRDTLRLAGARVIAAPAIRLVPTGDASARALGDALDRVSRGAGWLILPSPNAVEFFAEALDRLSIPMETLSGTRLAAVGPGTAERAGPLGLKVAFQPSAATGAALAAELPLERGMPVLIAGSARSRAELSEGLQARGAQVTLMPLYEPKPNPEGLEIFFEAIRSFPEAIVVAASPSAVDAIARSAGGNRFSMDTVRWVAIGPTTRSRLLALGAAGPRVVESADPGEEAVVQAIQALLRSRKAGGESA